MTLVALAVLVWAAAVYFAFTRPKADQTPAASATTESPAPEPSPAAPPLPSQEASSTVSGIAASSEPAPPEPSASGGQAPTASAAASGAASSAPTAASSAPPVATQDVTTCTRALLPEGSFAYREPDFTFVCSEQDPLKGGTSVRAQLVLGAGRTVTDGMRLWSGLGWFEMAAFSVLRARCCNPRPPLKWAFRLVCPVDEALAGLEKSVAERDEDATAAAVERYMKEVRCLSTYGQGRNFSQDAPPGAGIDNLGKILKGAGIELE